MRTIYKPKKLNTDDRSEKECTRAHADLAYRLCLLGATDVQVAEVLGIGVATLYRWRNKNKEFRMALRCGKMQADAEVAHSLYQKAKGYSHPDQHITVLKDRETGKVEKVITPTTKYYPPDTTACIFWLKNRQKDQWRDVNRFEHTGKDGKPILKRVQLDLSNLSDRELELAENLGLKLRNAAAVDEEDGLGPLRVRGNSTVN